MSIMNALEFGVNSLLVKSEPKTIANPNCKISRKYMEILLTLKEKTETYEGFFFHYTVLLGPEH